MLRESLKEVLIRRDKISAEEADKLILAAQQDLENYLMEDDMEAAYNICEDHFGLEPDYIEELY